LEAVARTAAVFFDVDFTLIHPGPMFQAVGYKASCARYGIDIDESKFDAAVAGAGSVLDDTLDQLYDAGLYVAYTKRIIQLMGGAGPRLEDVAQEIYDEWAKHHHFSLYDDVPGALRTLRERGVRLGLISNSHRCLASFQQHFELHGLIAAAISSSEHGYMKPHPSIFEAALKLVGARAEESIMVGDSYAHDIAGAQRVGIRGVLVQRSPDGAAQTTPDVTVIRDLSELAGLI
jgi:putative hydrolase of the HAD superfamily